MAQNIFIKIMYTFMAVLSQIDGGQMVGKNISDWFTPSYELDGKHICSRLNRDPKVLVLVASTPHKADHRNEIRHTWGFFGHTRDIAVGFVLGQSNSSTAKNIFREAKSHDDLIIGNFVDSYYNLTLKSLTMLDWAEKFCPMAKFLLKIDDDLILNPKILLEITRSNLNARKSIFGYTRRNVVPLRSNKSHKFYVSAAEYPLPIYPTYVTGAAYLMTADCISKLKKTAMHNEYMRLEDVFITGIVASKATIKRVFKKEFMFPTNLCELLRSIAAQQVPPKLKHFYWKILMNDAYIFSSLCKKYQSSFDIDSTVSNLY